MIPYNPSSFDTNKTILEQILELKNWLKEHPSYRIFASSENGNTSMTSTYDLTQVEENADLNVGDVVLFHNGCVGCVSSVDRDNNEFDCNYPCTNIKGPQGPRGYVTRITNIQVDSNGDLQVTIYNPDTQSSSTYNAGHVVGADGTNGTNGVDGASVTNAQIDASGDLEITIYDPATSTSTTTNVGHVVGTDGQGMQVINTTTSTGTLSASDLAKANGTDDCIVIFTDNGADLTMQRILKDSSNVYFYAHFVDTGKASYLLCEVNAVTGAYNIDGGDLPIKDSNINSGSATNGQVLTADGSGGASWQNAGGTFDHYVIVSSTSGTLTSDELNKLLYNDSVFIYNISSNNYLEYVKTYETNNDIYFEAMSVGSGIVRFTVNKSTRAFSRTTQGWRNGSVDSQTATSGQVLQADGNGGASWGLIGASSITSGTGNSSRILHSDGNGGATFSRIDAGTLTCGTATNGQVLTASSGNAVWQTPSGGTFDDYVIITTTSGTLSQDNINKLLKNDSVIIYQSGNNYNFYIKHFEDNTTLRFVRYNDNLIYTISITKSSGAYSRTLGYISGAGLSSTGATNGQVLTADGNGSSSWQNAGGGSSLYEHNIAFARTSTGSARIVLIVKILNNSSTEINTIALLQSYLQNTIGASIRFQATGRVETGNGTNIYSSIQWISYESGSIYISGIKQDGSTLSDSISNYSLISFTDKVVTL